LNGAILAMAFLSLATIDSVDPSLFWQQLVWFVIGFIVIFSFSQIDWRPLINYRCFVLLVYLIAVALLVITYFFAPAIRGAKSWLVFGPVQFQTSELAKAAMIIVFAYFFSHRHVGIGQWQNIFISFIYFAVVAGLVLLQPDVGSTLVFFGLWASFLLMSGIRGRHLAVGLLLVSLLLGWGWNNFLQDYQQERVIALFHPAYDQLGVNYSTIQSKIAIGSAGFLGKGFKQGTQVQLGFLLEAATDFVFAAFIEEWGLVGALVFLFVFFLIIWRLIRLGLLAEGNFAKFVCFGTAVLFLIHFVLNLGSNLGLLPVVGIPLPFFSYGGSNLLTNAMLVGIVQSIVVRSSF
jgi:rod shape determining protein RodA